MNDTATARDVAEASREKEWKEHSFLKALFLGDARLDLLARYDRPVSDRPAFRRFYEQLAEFLRNEVDPVEIDRTGEYPEHVIEGLARLGAFGMKIPTEYGGLGLHHREYVKVMELLGSHDANVTALLSAHQAIGVPQPVMLFGTEELKRKYLPRCARGEISAFAITEPSVGSDPSKITTTARKSEDGRHFILNGEKLWCTNGTLAGVIVVMARDPATGRINAFVVERDWDGYSIAHRCRFMGLKALANAVVRFDDVHIPVENLIGREGAGLKIALVTLNTGRLSIPAATAGGVKQCLKIVREWASSREQWGAPIGHHEAITHKIAHIATTGFAMEAVADLVGGMADTEETDIRMEAAVAKEHNTTRAWDLIDETLQIRGGRGYETERSLVARGEAPVGVERMMRDSRINRVFEGTSEIMHLFLAREAVDKHLELAGPLIDPKASLGQKAQAFLKSAAFYAWWYPSRWFSLGRFFRYRGMGRLARHARYVERTARRLARAQFHGILRYGPKLEKKQAFLFRLVDIGMELFAISAAIIRAARMKEEKDESAVEAQELADLFAKQARLRVSRLFRELRKNEDVAAYRLGRSVLEGRYLFEEIGTVDAPRSWGEPSRRAPPPRPMEEGEEAATPMPSPAQGLGSS